MYSLQSEKIESMLSRCIRIWDFFGLFHKFLKKWYLYYSYNKKREKNISFSYQIHTVTILKPFAGSLSRHLLLIRFLLMFGKNESCRLLSFYYKYPSI